MFSVHTNSAGELVRYEALRSVPENKKKQRCSKGWCPGNITERNLNARLKVGGRVANLKVSYPCDSTATHSLHLDSYNHHHNGFAPHYTWVTHWVFLSPAPLPP